MLNLICATLHTGYAGAIGINIIKIFLIILSLLITSNAFAGGAKLYQLQNEAKADNDGKLSLEGFHHLNSPHAINPGLGYPPESEVFLTREFD